MSTAGPRGLVAIFAHPDDESFGCGGTLALHAARGEPVTVVCATDGDQGGRPGEDAVDHSMDPEVRREELRCACRAMGAAEPVFLGYRDSGMEGWGAPDGALSLADPEEVVERLVEQLRRLRPATVVTFDPGGIYGHPDHVAISAHASEAFRRAATEPGGPRALYHQALPRSGAGRLRRLLEELAAATGETLPPPSQDDLRQQEAFERLSRPDEEITTVVDVGPTLDAKLAALACHGSQMRGRQWEALPRPMVEEQWRHETFVRVVPAPAPGTQETDLLT
ncbi:MAG TPA: PIG-L deacetylase family protein [Candidatus Limnocylindrales bacterium]